MRVAVLSDIHDNVWNLEAALRDIAEQGADLLFFLGDFCAPFTLAQMAEGFRGEIHAVFGNNDGDPFLLAQVAAKFDHVHLHGPFAELELAGRRVALHHYPEVALRLAESSAYDAVFYGHDHRRNAELVGITLWANPGEVMGRFGAPSYGLYTPVTQAFQHVDIRRE